MAAALALLPVALVMVVVAADRPDKDASPLREVGGSGVRTLVLVDGQSRRLLDSHALDGPAEDLLALFEPTPARA